MERLESRRVYHELLDERVASFEAYEEVADDIEKFAMYIPSLEENLTPERGLLMQRLGTALYDNHVASRSVTAAQSNMDDATRMEWDTAYVLNEARLRKQVSKL